MILGLHIAHMCVPWDVEQRLAVGVFLSYPGKNQFLFFE
jgi:hypothetical protein